MILQYQINLYFAHVDYFKKSVNLITDSRMELHFLQFENLTKKISRYAYKNYL